MSETNRISRNQKLAFYVAIATVIFLALAATQTRVATGWSGRLSPTSREIIDKQRVDAFLGKEHEASLFCLRMGEADFFDDLSLAAIGELARSIEDSGYFYNDGIKSLTHLTGISFEDGVIDSESFLPRDALPLSETAKSRLRSDIENAPFLYGPLVAKDFSAVLIAATYQELPEDRMGCYLWQIALKEKMRRDYGLELSILDDVMVNAEADKGVILDSLTWPNVTIAFIALLLFLLLGRRLRHVMGFFLLVFLSVVSLLGMMVLLGFPFSVLFVCIPIMQIVAAGSDYPYLGLSDKARSPTRLVESLWKPISMGAITTAISAGTLGFSEIEQIRQFGITAATGILLTSFYALTIIPVYFFYVDRRFPAVKAERRDAWGLRALTSLVLRVWDHPPWRRWSLTGACALTLGALFLAVLVESKDNYVEDYFATDSPVVRSASVFREEFGGYDTFKILVETGGSFRELEKLEILDEVQRRIGRISYTKVSPAVRIENKWTNTLGIPPQMPRSFSSLANALLAERGARTYGEEGVAFYPVAQMLSLVDIVSYVYTQWTEGTGGYLPEDPAAYRYLQDNFLGEVLQHYDGELFDESLEHAVIEVILATSETSVHQHFYDRVKDIEASLPGVTISLGGYQMKWLTFKRHIVDLKLKNIVWAISLVWLVATVFFTLSNRNPVKGVFLGVVTVAPVGMGIVWTFAFFYFCNISLNILTATVSAISIGIGVNFALHLLYRFNREWSLGSCRATLRAITTDLLTSLGFIFMAGSAVVPIRQIGVLLTFSLIAAFVLTVTVCPGLLGSKLGIWVFQNKKSIWRRTGAISLAKDPV